MDSKPDWEFESIRPYRDDEVSRVLEPLIRDENTYRLLGYALPDLSAETAADLARSVTGILDLQHKFSYPALQNILKWTTGGLSYDGFDHLDARHGNVIVSNHRDILLDSGFLNVALTDLGLPTVETGSGDNLFISDFITDLLRLNKVFKVHRQAPPKELLFYAQRLSAYIKSRVEVGASVWLAQRNGRTKDGDDRTDTGMLKMLTLAHPDLSACVDRLRIVPMAISYEYEPCILSKAQTLYNRHYAPDLKFEARKKEDLKDMLSGITDPKGRIHLALGEPLSRAEAETLDKIARRNERMEAFAKILDQRILGAYKLWPTHYAATDLLRSNDDYSEHYSPEERSGFVEHIDKLVLSLEGETDLLRRVLMQIYAQPVLNRFELAASP